jgi:hypothetical protein
VVANVGLSSGRDNTRDREGAQLILYACKYRAVIHGTRMK